MNGIDWAAAAKIAFGVDFWETPNAIQRAIFKPRARVAVKGCHASGKCVAASEYLTLADGRRVQAADLVGQEFSLLTYDTEQQAVRPVAASATFNAVEPVFAVETESGRRIVRNADHPLWAATGMFPAGNRCKITPLEWTHVHDLEPGMLVAVPESLPTQGETEMHRGDIKLLAYLLGDGGVTQGGARFTQLDGAVLDEFAALVDQVGARLLPCSDKITYRVVAKEDRRGVRDSNPVISLLRVHGLLNKHSREKRIPAAIFSLPLPSLAIFLSRLYATDGWACVGKNRVAEIGFCSASEGMIRDLQELLLRFGVCGRITKKPKVNAWCLIVNASTDLLTFITSIGIFGKGDAVERVRERAVEMAATKQRRVWRWKHLPPGLRWERVKTVEPAGVEATVAIEVPEGNTFLTTFWEHNTHGVARSIVMALAAGGDVITTAPTGDQVKGVLWQQIEQAVKESYYDTSDWRINQTGIVLPDGGFAMGRSTDQGVRFQGYHARPGSFLLIVVDEAPGVISEIMGAIEGISAGGDVRLIILGNPLVPSGSFYEVFAAQMRGWTRFTINAFKTPNFRSDEDPTRFLTLEELLAMPEDEGGPLDQNPREYLITRRWVQERYYQWGTGHPYWYGRVLGAFPVQASGSLIPLLWIEQAEARPSTYRKGKPITAGIDVSGEGEDETVVSLVQGDDVLEQAVFTDPDPRGGVLRFLRPWISRGLRTVNVDKVGLGIYFTAHLRDNLPAGVKVRGINVGEAPIDDPNELDEDGKPIDQSDRFNNLKSQLYWDLRERFREGRINGLVDPVTRTQLASIMYGADPKGRTVIESKKDARKRGIKSPDRAESLMLAFAPPEPVDPRSLLYGKSFTEVPSNGVAVRPGQLAATPGGPGVDNTNGWNGWETLFGRSFSES